MIEKGKIYDGKTLISVMLYDRLGRLRRKATENKRLALPKRKRIKTA